MPSPVASTRHAFAWLAAFAVFLAAQSAVHADPAPAVSASAPSLEGAYSQGPLHETYTVQQWITACGPAPTSNSSGGGESITVAQSGPELVFTGGGRTYRTDQCYDPLPTLHVDVHTRDQTGTSWRNHCATGPSDPRRATIQSLVTVNGARELNITETGRYEITLSEGTCIADIRRSRSFTRVAAPPPTPTPQAPPSRTAAPVDTAPAATACAHPGAAASLEIRPAHHSLRVGDTLPLQATVRDSAGCALPAGSTSSAGTPRFKLLGDDGGKVTVDDKGVVSVAADAPEATVHVQVTAAGTTGQADITVVSRSHYDELLANGDLDAGSDEAQITVIAPSELGGEGVRARDASQRRRAIFIAIISAAVLALIIVALVYSRRAKKAAKLETIALERHEERVRDIENRRGQVRQAHAEQVQAHEQSVQLAQKQSLDAAKKKISPVSSASLAAAARRATPAAGVVSDLPPPDAALVCTTCRRDFPPRGSRQGGGGIFCPFDATRLTVAASPAGARAVLERGGSTCPTCHRGYPPGVRVCAIDGDELAPTPLVRPPPHQAAGARGKICPTCGSRFEGVAAFCGKDGTQLVLLN